MSHAPQRPIREAAIQFLYSLTLAGSEEASADHPFWQILFEQDLEKLARARATAALFQSQGHPKLLDQLEQRVGPTSDCLAPFEQSESLRQSLQRLLKLERDFAMQRRAIEKLQEQLKHSDKVELADAVEDLLESSAVLPAERLRIQRDAADYPACRETFEGLLATLRKLDVISCRLATIANAAEHLDDPAVRHIAKEEIRLRELREQATEIVSQILKHCGEIDERIAVHIENYQPERLTATDRAILRCGVWELFFDPAKSPPALVISEAVKLAKRLSTSQSAAFVNGVLDAIHRNSKTQA